MQLKQLLLVLIARSELVVEAPSRKSGYMRLICSV